MRLNRWERAGLILVLIIIAAVCVSGCGTSPYMKLGTGYATNYEEWVFQSQVGIENERYDISWVHASVPHKGAPFNRRPDYVSLDTITVSYKFGGR